MNSVDQLKRLGADREWTLFLDRDGVINRRIPDDYVRTWDQFEFLPGSVEAIAALSQVFGRVIVVTNQQGVGKGLMTEDDVHAVHDRMIKAIEAGGGRVDATYICPHLAGDGCPCRKPATGMALSAQADHPEIDFARSLLAGDSDHDVALGAALGMTTAGLGDRITLDLAGLDFHLPGLAELAAALCG